jgi:hypothetical protein
VIETIEKYKKNIITINGMPSGGACGAKRRDSIRLKGKGELRFAQYSNF